MARRKPSFVADLIAITGKLPWVGVALALAAYAGLHSLASHEAAAVVQSGKMGGFVNPAVFKTLAGVGQYLLPVVFLAWAGLSAYGRHARRVVHRTAAASPDHAALNDMSWKKFEALVGEAFRRKGYSVTGSGRGGPDGGGDLALKKDGALFLVQCKQWRAIRVGVRVARELYGEMAARGAAGGFVVTSGVFTDEALAFAQGKNIELMDGKALHALIRGVTVPPRFFRDPLSITTDGAPFCPECQSRMVKRKVKRGSRAGQVSWSCIRYPDCRGSRPV